jgi:hypothetical protein
MTDFLFSEEKKTFPKPAIFFFGASLFFAVLWYWKFHALPLMQPDSESYMTFSPVRTIGYPFFLWVVKRIFGTLDVIPVIQLSLLTFSVTYLANAFFRLTRGYFLTFALIAGVMINPGYIHVFNIMTEPVSVAILVAFMATAINFFQKPSLKDLAQLSLFAGLAILVRPVHYAYIPILMILGLITKFPIKVTIIRRFLTSVTPLFLLILLGCVGQYAKNGMFKLENLGGFNMIGKVSLIAEKEIPSRHPEFLKEALGFSVPTIDYLDKTPNLHIRYILSAPYYDYFRYSYLPEISKRLPVDDGVYAQTSWDIIKSYPIAYAQDVWMNFSALWQLHDLLTVKEKMLLKSFIDSHQPSPYIVYPWYPNTINFSIKHHPFFVWGLRLILLGIAVSGLIMLFGSLIALLRGREVMPLILTGATAALVTQGHFLLIALSQAGLPRYSFSMWPTIVFVGIIVLEIGRQKWKGQPT